MEASFRPLSLAEALLALPSPAALCRAECLMNSVTQLAAQSIQQARAPAGAGRILVQCFVV